MNNDNVSKSISTILDLYNKYKDNQNLLNSLNSHIQNLNTIMEKEYNTNTNNYQKEKEYFIEEFLNDNLNVYYYIKNNDLFIEYDGKDYKIIKEDDIWHKILININSNLSSFKVEIKDEIIKQLKDNSISNSLPESNTIQKIINYFTSMMFESKEESKYFLCLLGDSFLNKNDNSINIYTHKDSFIFLNYILSQHRDYFNLEDSNIINKFSSKIINPLDDNRILKFKDLMLHNNQELWMDFIHFNFLNILAVSVHYSNRYESSEKYIIQRSNKKLRFKILYLKSKNYLNIIDDFKLSMEKKEGYKILKKDMFYLWKKFLETKNIFDDITNRVDLDILFDEHFKKNDTNEYFMDFYDSNIEIITSFKKYINSDIVSSSDDELEVSELTMLYNEYYNREIYLGESDILSLLNYYYSDLTFLIDNKILLNIRSINWNKKEDLNKCILSKFGKTVNNDITFTKAYKYYCSFLKNIKIFNIASKKYFEKHIVKMIDLQYISNNKILKDFWSN